MTKAKVIQLFAVPVNSFHWDEQYNEELKDFVNDLIFHTDNNRGGGTLCNYFNTSDTNLLNVDADIIKKFDKYLRECYKEHISVYGWKLSDDCIIQQCWVNECWETGFQSKHCHANAFTSGTHYVDFPVGSSPIRFWNPSYEKSHPFMMPLIRGQNDSDAFEGYNKDKDDPYYNIYSTEDYCIMPEEGETLLWASNISHATFPNRTNRRISISFNMVPPEIDTGVYKIAFT